MSEQLLTDRIEELRQAAIAKDRVEQFDEALALFDEALSLAEDDETRELITINKAHAMIGAQRSGPEVQALPMVLMRRRNPRHTFLAAYALLYKHRLSGEMKCFRRRAAWNVAEALGRRQRLVSRRRLEELAPAVPPPSREARPVGV